MYTVAIAPVGPSLKFLVTKPAAMNAPGSAFYVDVDPQPAPFPNVLFSVDGGAARVDGPVAGGVAHLAPDDGGVATIHAFVGPPVNKRIDATVFAYRSLVLDCVAKPGGSGVALSYHQAVEPAADRMELAVSGAACSRAQRRDTSRALVHVPGPAFDTPYGATLVPADSLDAFAGVSVHAFVGDLTTLPEGATGAAIVRTRTGALFKVWLPAGRGAILDAPYVLTGNGDEFPDAVFVAAPHPQNVGSVPEHMRIPGPTPAPQTSTIG